MLYKIDGFVNCSKWGKLGSKSYIERFLHKEEYLNTHLAELWFGTHPNGMSTVDVNGRVVSLQSYLKSRGGSASLPYLAKILSVDSPLSIQLHPPKEVAERLHAENPRNYPDSKAKPEMSVALTDVELLCGVRNMHVIREHIGRISAFSVFGGKFQLLLNAGNLRDLSKYIFNLSVSELNLFADQILVNNIEDEWTKLASELLKLGNPIDPGIVYLYLLEYLKIQPGEAIFIEPGVPHAYISGDMFECMNASDNVVRGGLTTKYIDKDTFIALFRDVPYDCSLLPISIEGGVKEYRPRGCPFVVRHLCSTSPVVMDVSARSIVINLKGLGSIKSETSIENLIEATAYFLPNACSTLELIPENILETFLISPN